jgi:hypothetical protein
VRGWWGMDFIDEIRQFSEKAKSVVPHLKTEEATKTSLILPFLQVLGYNIFDPLEVVPEFTADVGTKKGEKVDYAIMVGGKPAILIEAKAVTDVLNGHGTQLFRYFTTTPAKFAILTNGLVYKFYSDLQEPNKMDDQAFLEFNLLDPREAVVAEVKKFHKESFNAEDLFSAAANLKYSTQIRAILESELREPSDEFLRFLLRDVHVGKITQNVLEKFRPVVKRTIGVFFSEMIGDKLKTAIETTMESERQVAVTAQEPTTNVEPEPAKPAIVTTLEELESFYTIKSIVRDAVDPKRLSYKDTASYFSVLIDSNVRKWLCRLWFGESKKALCLHAEDKSETWLPLETIDDLFKYRNEILATATRIAGTKT